MLQTLADWARQMVILIMVTTFLEALVPENEMKKFVRVALGFFILAAVAQPILQILPRAGGLKIPTMAAWEESREWESMTGEEINQTLVWSVFQENAAREAERAAQAVVPGAGIRAEVDANPEQGIRRITLYVDTKQGADKAREAVAEFFQLPAQQVEIVQEDDH